MILHKWTVTQWYSPERYSVNNIRIESGFRSPLYPCIHGWSLVEEEKRSWLYETNPAQHICEFFQPLNLFNELWKWVNDRFLLVIWACAHVCLGFCLAPVSTPCSAICLFTDCVQLFCVTSWFGSPFIPHCVCEAQTISEPCFCCSCNASCFRFL